MTENIKTASFTTVWVSALNLYYMCLRGQVECEALLRPLCREEFQSKVQSFGFPVNMLWCSKPHKEMITTLTGFIPHNASYSEEDGKPETGEHLSGWLTSSLLSISISNPSTAPWRHSLSYSWQPKGTTCGMASDRRLWENQNFYVELLLLAPNAPFSQQGEKVNLSGGEGGVGYCCCCWNVFFTSIHTSFQGSLP